MLPKDGGSVTSELPSYHGVSGAFGFPPFSTRKLTTATEPAHREVQSAAACTFQTAPNGRTTAGGDVHRGGLSVWLVDVIDELGRGVDGGQIPNARRVMQLLHFVRGLLELGRLGRARGCCPRLLHRPEVGQADWWVVCII